MAKRPNENGAQKPAGSLRVRWVEVEVTGADSTIEEALRTVERMRRPVIETLPSAKRISESAPSAKLENDHVQQRSLFDDAEPEPEDIGAEADKDASSEPSTPVNPAPRKRGTGEVRDRNAGIRLIGDIDFVPKGRQSLKAFFAEKSPTSDLDQVLVFCHFLQHVASISQIGPGHILSAFKHVAKPVPKDLKQTIRNLKDKKAWLGGTGLDDIRLTTEGENRVEYELGNETKSDGEH